MGRWTCWAAAGALLALTSGAAWAQADAARTITVQAYGGQWEEGLRKAVIAPFERANRAKVEVVLIGSSTQVLARMRAEKARPSMDVVLIGGGTETTAISEGLFEKIDFTNIPNAKDIHDKAASPVPGYGPSVNFVSFQLAYNTERVKPKPESWDVLWNPAYKGKIAIPGLDTNPGVMLLHLLNQRGGGTLDNIEPGLARLVQLKSNDVVIWTGIPDAQTKLAQGDTWLTIITDGRVSGMAREGFPIDMACPREGCFVTYTYANVVAGSQRKALAEAFINQFLDPESQRVFAEIAGNGPVNRKTVLDPKTARWVVYGEEQVKSLIDVPWDEVAKRRDQWVDQWNKRMLSR